MFTQEHTYFQKMLNVTPTIGNGKTGDFRNFAKFLGHDYVSVPATQSRENRSVLQSLHFG